VYRIQCALIVCDEIVYVNVVVVVVVAAAVAAAAAVLLLLFVWALQPIFQLSFVMTA
jgi:hypothetical protein